jgi:hypothetical protein
VVISYVVPNIAYLLLIICCRFSPRREVNVAAAAAAALQIASGQIPERNSREASSVALCNRFIVVLQGHCKHDHPAEATLRW